MKKIILIICLGLSLNIQAEEFNGLFGFKMGQVIDTSVIFNHSGYPIYLNKFENYFNENISYGYGHYLDIKDEVDINLKYSVMVTPLVSNEYFNKSYFIFFSPLSHRIIGIQAFGDGIEDPKRCLKITREIFQFLNQKYSSHFAIDILEQETNKIINAKKNTFYFLRNKIKNNQIENKYLIDLGEEDYFINNKFKEDAIKYIIDLRNENFDSINSYYFALDCNRSEFSIKLSSTELNLMNQYERKVIGKWSDLIRFTYINDEVDKSGF